MTSAQWKKIQENLPVGFAADAEKMSNDKLKHAIANAALRTQDIATEKENDKNLKSAENVAKELREPYNDAKKAQEAKIKYCSHLLTLRNAR